MIALITALLISFGGNFSVDSLTIIGNTSSIENVKYERQLKAEPIHRDDQIEMNDIVIDDITGI